MTKAAYSELIDRLIYLTMKVNRAIINGDIETVRKLRPEKTKLERIYNREYKLRHPEEFEDDDEENTREYEMDEAMSWGD